MIFLEIISYRKFGNRGLYCPKCTRPVSSLHFILLRGRRQGQRKTLEQYFSASQMGVEEAVGVKKQILIQ